MPSRIAQRSSKPAKKLSKRVVLYVPDTFDPDIHLPAICATLLTTPDSCFTESTWAGFISEGVTASST